MATGLVRDIDPPFGLSLLCDYSRVKLFNFIHSYILPSSFVCCHRQYIHSQLTIIRDPIPEENFNFAVYFISAHLWTWLNCWAGFCLFFLPTSAYDWTVEQGSAIFFLFLPTSGHDWTVEQGSAIFIFAHLWTWLNCWAGFCPFIFAHLWTWLNCWAGFCPFIFAHLWTWLNCWAGFCPFIFAHLWTWLNCWSGFCLVTAASPLSMLFTPSELEMLICGEKVRLLLFLCTGGLSNALFISLLISKLFCTKGCMGGGGGGTGT